MEARLEPIDDAPPLPLTRDLTLVGRTADCDVRFEHKSVSKLHCLLVKTDGLVLLRDLGSTNGTRVNGTRVRRAVLLPNDLLAVAGFRYRLKFAGVPDDSDERSDAAGPATGPDADDDGPDEKPLDPRSPPLRLNALPDAYPERPKRPM